MNDAMDAPGWDAIDEALQRPYPEQEPQHWATQRGIAFGEALQGVSAYEAADHWHYISYGLSELFAKSAQRVIRKKLGVPGSEWLRV
jgi:hypothetical protein